MSAIPFLSNRQIGTKTRSRLGCYPTLNFEHVLSRLICHKQDIFSIRGEETDVPPFACKFRKDAKSDLLAVANEDGEISVYNTTRRSYDNLVKSFTAHHNAIFDIRWLPDKCHLISGSGDHNAALWDMSCCRLISIFKKHSASIKSVDVCHEQSAIFATGSRDGSINVWDVREKNSNVHLKPAINISQAHSRKNTVHIGKRSVQKDPVSNVSAVAFQDSNKLASAGVADGVVKIWDLRRTYIPNTKYLPSPSYRMTYSDSERTAHGCTSLVFDSQFRTLYACSTNHKILKFDCHSYPKEVDTKVSYEGFRCATYFVKLDLSSDDQYLLCGSSNDKAYIWKTSKPGLPVVQLSVHSAEVTSVCWSPYDITKLATCGDDNKVAVWKVADTENVKITDDVVGIAEPYSEIPKNGSPFFQNTVQSSIITSNIPVKKSPVQSTPNKPGTRAITSFFSPITPSIVQSLSNDIQSKVTINTNSPSPSSSVLNKTPVADETSSLVLTPSNHINKSNIMHQSPNDNSETFSSPELKNSSPDNKNSASNFFSSSSSVKNKENTSKKTSPETSDKKNNIAQTKRKISPKHSTPNLKRKHTERSKKTTRFLKTDKNPTSGKTLMNYFSVVLPSNN